MSEETKFRIRLSKASREFNISIQTIVKFLAKKGFVVDSAPNIKLTEEMYNLLVREFQGEKEVMSSAKKLGKLSYRGGTVSLESVGKLPNGTINKSVKKEADTVVKKKSRKKKTVAAKSIKKKEKKVNIEKTEITKICKVVSFSSFKFGNGFVSIKYDEGRYAYYNDSKIKDYDKSLVALYSIISEKNKRVIMSAKLEVLIDSKKGTFTFKNIDIHKYIKQLVDTYLPDTSQKETHNETPTISLTSSTIKTMALGLGNIRFYKGYYLISRIAEGKIDDSIIPFKIDDPNSEEILNLVHNYFEQRFKEMNIVVKYDDSKIHKPSELDMFQLNRYLKTLIQNLDEKGLWWEEVQNAKKRSFSRCLDESETSVKSKITRAKNEYLYNLSSLQKDKKLIRVYEINHGKEEDAFIFTISMPNNRYAVVFENASNIASTTTWLFVAKNENYESCVNLVFDYFTDYTIINKRSSLRAVDINPPHRFKAESYAFIDHNDLGQWLKRLNKILEQNSQLSEIVFVPGLNIPNSSETRMSHNGDIITGNLHNNLMRKLYDKLCLENGEENVGTEIMVGRKRIDAVVKGNDFYDIYEVKTEKDPFDCVTQALGQLCQYAYLFCRDKIGKLVVVGPSKTTNEVEQYLSTLRKNHSLRIHYISV